MRRRTLLAAFGGAALAGPVLMADRRYYVPPEEAPHRRTFMQWPVSRRVHRDSVFLRSLQATIARVASTISEFEPVVMLMGAEHATRARRQLGRRVEIWDVPTDDLWARDSGPLFAQKGSDQVVMSLGFNGWGGKQGHREDGQVAARVAKRLGLSVVDSGVVGEAGGVETDGHGMLIAYESCWVNPNRNPKRRRAHIERALLAAYGANRMVWAPGVKGADITDYHIDSLARFAAPGHVVIQMPDRIDPRDPWSRAAFETHDILKAAGLTLSVIPEPEAPRVRSRDFVASYVNYYVCNGGVICAQLGGRTADREAQRILTKLYPGREVVALNVDAIGEVGGGIHCATQQQPR